MLLTKSSEPATAPLVSCHRRAIGIEFINQSPRGLKTADLGGVGLGIVAALHKSGDIKRDLQLDRTGVCRSLRRSDYNYRRRSGGENKNTHLRFDRTRLRNSHVGSVFHISPTDVPAAGPPSDFLSACNLCRKKLHGKDIYIYRGEKAFCSEECRWKHIAAEEPKEKEKEKYGYEAPSCAAGKRYNYIINGELTL